MSSITSLENPLYKSLPKPLERQIKGKGLFDLPAGTRIVSADNHWDVASDIFFERLPEHLKEKAPRIWLDKFIRIGFMNKDGQLESPFKGPEREMNLHTNLGLEGCWDIDARLAHLDAEGIEADMNYPNMILLMFGHPDLELREAVFRIYNQHQVELNKASGGRCHGVGIVPNWWDPDKAEAVVQEIVDLGLKAMMLPLKAGNDLNGKPILFSEPGSDRLMKAIEQSGIPLCFHIGETPHGEGRGARAITVMSSLQPFSNILAQMIFGRVFDRCPNLKVVFAEGGLSWILPALQDAEGLYDFNPYFQDEMPKLRPMEYWHRNCYATFMCDRLGLSMLNMIGVDRVMWAEDYPHSEGTFGYCWDAMKQVMDMAGVEAAPKILGGTAASLFNI